MNELKLENAKTLVKMIIKGLAENGLSNDIYFDHDMSDEQYKKDYELKSYQHLYIGDVFHVMINPVDVKIYVYPILYFHTSEYGIPSEYAKWEAHDEGSEEIYFTDKSMVVIPDDMVFEFSTEEEKFQQTCTEDGFYIEAIDALFKEINIYFPEVWDKS